MIYRILNLSLTALMCVAALIFGICWYRGEAAPWIVWIVAILHFLDLAADYLRDAFKAR